MFPENTCQATPKPAKRRLMGPSSIVTRGARFRKSNVRNSELVMIKSNLKNNTLLDKRQMILVSKIDILKTGRELNGPASVVRRAGRDSDKCDYAIPKIVMIKL